MGLKKYIIFSLIFIVIIGLYVYSLNGNTYAMTFFDMHVSLPIAVWVILPASLIVIATILHIIFYNFKDYLVQRNLQKDYKNFIQYTKNKMLKINFNNDFKTKWFKLPAKILNYFEFDPNKNLNNLDNEELKNIILDLKKIENGESIDLKKYKLPKNNYYTRKNILNKLAKDKKYADEILNNCGEDKQENEVCKKAFEIYATYATYGNIKKQNFNISKELFLKLIDRTINKEDNFKIENNEIFEYLKKYDFSPMEYLLLAKKMKNSFPPEVVMSLFEKVSLEKEKAMQAYLYTLFEYQMINKAREVLENSGKGEFEKFKYFLFLRDNGKNFDIDLFFDI